MDFNAWLSANGYDESKLTQAQRKHLEAAWKAECSPPPVAPPVKQDKEEKKDSTMEAIIEAGRKEQKRREDITQIVSRAVQERPDRIDTIERLGQQALEGKWDTDRLELQMLRDLRPGASAVQIVRDDPVVSSRLIEAAVCKAGGLANLEKSFDAQTLESSDKNFKHGIGLAELLHLTAQRNGWRGRTIRSDLRGALRAALDRQGMDIRAEVSPSTYDLSSILANVSNKFLREGFMAVEMVWREISAIRSVPDFKAITSYSLTGDNTYEQVAPGGEIKHGTLGTDSYTNQLDTYGKLLGIDRRDLINDDLGALTGVSRRLGRGGGLKLNEVFWAEFLDNSTFFTTGHANYDDGATDTAMTVAGLANADTLFRLQTDQNSKPTSIMPAILLVPPAQRAAAMNLMNSTMLNMATSTTAVNGTANIWAGMFRVLSSVYLASSAFTGYSSVAWYLLANPSDMPVIETCFLNGVETPTVESADMDFDRLGIALRGYHDFGVALQEYRGGVKMKGEA